MSETQMLMAAVAALAAVVVALFARYEIANARTVKRLEDCETDRLSLWRWLAQAGQKTCGVDECDKRVQIALPPLKNQPPAAP